MPDTTIDSEDKGASEKPQSGNKPLGKQVDNLIVEDEAKRVWELLFGPNDHARTQDGRYVIGRRTFTEYFVATFDRLTEGNDLVSLYPEWIEIARLRMERLINAGKLDNSNPPIQKLDKSVQNKTNDGGSDGGL